MCIRDRNYLMAIAHVTAIVTIIISVESIKVMILTHKDYLAVDHRDAPLYVGQIFLFDIAVRIVASAVAGVLNDYLGRKIIVSAGYLITALGVGMLPYQKSVYPGFVFWWCVYTFGMVTANSAPLSGDYIHNETKGKAAGITFFATACGGILGTLVTGVLLDFCSLGFILSVFAVFGVCIAFVSTLFLRGGLYHKAMKPQGSTPILAQEDKPSDGLENEALEDSVLTETPTEDPKSAVIIPNDAVAISAPTVEVNNAETQSFKEYLRTAYRQCSKQAWLIMSFINAFLEGSEGYIISVFMILWAQKFAPLDDASQLAANKLGTNLARAACSAIMIFSLLFGYLIDRVSKFVFLLCMYLCMILGMTFMITYNEPASILSLLAMFVVGTGITGEAITSNYLSIRYTNDENRGLITGAVALAQALGAFYNNFLGSYLFEIIDKNAPFIMFMITTFIAAKILVVLYFAKLRKADKNEAGIHQGG
eukprot:TRINITY_DN30796_c0_g1_i2.p1 TRINITY_DN30796_c0_g1~~TRINITY_DN30796_c0_g1_i2.p1  ORF type:complete len:480 (-),score=137.74 TRINITY_DN30796_c0_g1_i2:79-1518(-)